MRQEKADQILAILLEYGINHIDTAASYGDSELRIGPWMARHRRDFFLATKTGDRTASGARDSLHRSLDRLRVDHVDLISFTTWSKMQNGRLPSARAVRSKRSLTRARRDWSGYRRDWSRHPRCRHASGQPAALSVRLHSPAVQFRHDAVTGVRRRFRGGRRLREAHGVAVQTIKAVARRRWRDDDPQRRFSWYEPLKDPDAIRRAVRFVLGRPGLFLNSSSDATILRHILDAANDAAAVPSGAALEGDVSRFGVEPLFVRGVSDAI